MGTLRRVIPALLVLASAPGRADDVGRWRPLIEEASSRLGVPTRWIERVMWAESRGRISSNGRPIRSSAGAIGLMQLMPATWSAMRARLGLGRDPDDPHDNILAGTFFLRLMYDRFGYPGLFGAYNAGPGAYAAFLAGKRSLPGETTAYLGVVASGLLPATPSSRPGSSRSLFILRHDASGDTLSAALTQSQSSLFAVRKVAP